MMIIYDKSEQDFDHNGLGVLNACESAIVTHLLNGEYALELIYPATDYKANHLEELNIIKANGQLFRIYKVERIQSERLTIHVWARHIFYDLAFFFIESAKVLNADLEEAITMVIPPEVQILYAFKGYETTLAPFAVKEVSVLDAVFTLIGVYGGELKRDNYKVEIKKQLGENKGVTLRYSKNIKGLTLTLDSSLMATKIYPVGDGGIILPERYIELSNSLPFDITRKVEFKSCLDVDSLREAAKQYITNAMIPKMNIAIDFIELSKTNEYKGFEHLNHVEVGDFVRVYHEKLKVQTVLKVIKKQENLLDPMASKIELGDPLDTIIEKLDNEKLLEEVAALIESNKTGLLIKKNSETLTIRTTKYPAIALGVTTKAAANLTATLTLTGYVSSSTTLHILFYLNDTVYDLKPVQKLAQGDNILGFSLPMTQVPPGSHSFIVELWVTEAELTIERNNIQVTIEGLHIEGGLTATIPRIEVIASYFYKLFYAKAQGMGVQAELEKVRLIENVNHINKELIGEDRLDYFKDMYVSNQTLSTQKVGIVERFEGTIPYVYDKQWIQIVEKTEQQENGNYETFKCIEIDERPFVRGGSKTAIGSSVYKVDLPSKTLYRDLVSIHIGMLKEGD